MTTTTETTIPAAGGEEAHTVFISLRSTDQEGGVIPASICIDSKVDMTPGQAREVATALNWFAEEVDPTPANPAVLGVVEEVARSRGVTLAELATVAGVDLESLTAADMTKLGMTLIHWEERLAAHLLRVMESSSD